MARQIATALEVAHRKNILHRDLKPANILVTPAGQAKLLDFGLATLTGADRMSPGRSTGLVIGTAPYMSPEQAEGGPLDHRSDIFSFGAVLYELLTGNRAFGGATALQALKAVTMMSRRPSRRRPVSSASSGGASGSVQPTAFRRWPR